MAAFAAQFSDVCVQTAVWQRVTGRDRAGKPSYGSPILFAPPTGCRKSFKFRRVSSAPKGQVIDAVSDSQILILAPLVGIGYDDLVYVLGDTVFPSIVAWEMPVDETGEIVYTKVLLGKFTG